MVKSSFIDYPGKISAVIFTGGCNFRCGYCHNPELVYGNGQEINEQYIFDFLAKRKNYLDGVCISGGEPTLQKDLFKFIQVLKGKGYLVKLDTNGTHPEVISELINQKWIDYIAMDIKGSLDRYSEIVHEKVNIEKISESIDIIMNSAVDYEFRTTIHKEILNIRDLFEIVERIKGAERYSIQNIKKTGPVLMDEAAYTAFTRDELDHMKEELNDYVKELNIRY